MNYKRQTRIAHTLILVFVGVICLAWVVPLVMVVAASFTDEAALVEHGYQLIPPVWSIEAYKWLWNDPQMIISAYGVSIVVTVIGTLVSLLIMSMLAYTLAQKRFRSRGILTFFVFFTMLFNGGLVPYYINMSRNLQLKNSLLALILPYLVVPFFVLLLRTYFYTIPRDLFDAARVDGASEWHIYSRIALPLSTPALATVGLFSMLQYWNDFYQALLFIENPRLYPLQYMLYNLMRNQQVLNDFAVQTGQPVPHLSVTMAMAVVALVPIVLAFLFVQRYFVRGITLGGLKGE